MEDINSAFIDQHKDTPLNELVLLLSKKDNLDKTFILQQVNGLQKAKKKLPEFYANPSIHYPPAISMEQCSSEHTANYKSKLVFEHVQKPTKSNPLRLLDLTGGYGIDSFYFSKHFGAVTYIEPNEALYAIVKHNFHALEAQNIVIHNSDATQFLNQNQQKFDAVYIDPSRRNVDKRVFKLEECTPNILALMDDIFKITETIVLKTAPILDIQRAVSSLEHVEKIVVVSLNNECKEVLYFLSKQKADEILVETINLAKKPQTFCLSLPDENAEKVMFSDPLKYIYEPNASILKSGAFNSIGNSFNLYKLAPNSHLYTSENLCETFPGRTFHIETVIPYKPKAFKKLGIAQANVATRNFKDKPHEIKKKLNLKDGGDTYIFGTTNQQNKPIILITKQL